MPLVNHYIGLQLIKVNVRILLYKMLKSYKKLLKYKKNSMNNGIITVLLVFTGK